MSGRPGRCSGRAGGSGAVRQIVPDLKILLASGFAVDGHAQALLERGGCGFIQKPFDTATLAAKLRTLR